MSRSSKLILGAIALASTPVVALAQQAADPYNPSRFQVEPYLSQSWAKSDATDKYEGLGGFGVRVIFGHSTASDVVSTFFNRAQAGAYLTYSSGDNSAKLFHYGVEADFPLLAAPRVADPGFRIDPFIGVGLGIFHTSVDNPGNPGTNITSNDFAFVPAAGILLPITGEIKVRGDLRDAIVFGDKTTNNFTLEGGISIGF
jgi:hypothetical protein